MNAFTDNIEHLDNKLSKRYVISRIYVTISILLSLLFTLFDKTQVNALSFQVSHFPPFPLYIGVVVCLISLIDIIANDFLSPNIKCMWTYHNRHIIFLVMGLFQISLSVDIISSFGQSMAFLGLWLDGLVAAVIATLDLIVRHKGESWNSGNK